jgi:hypothetical protein
VYIIGIFFANSHDHSELFHRIRAAHRFQRLTESNKPGTAFRSGLYLSPVNELEPGRYDFNLLRCSSNLSGPTENFQAIDHMIVNRLNEAAAADFNEPAEFNHVLAQVYENRNCPAPTSSWWWNYLLGWLNWIWSFFCVQPLYPNQQRKAKIKAHTDKTKDMPETGGLIAFCTFYDLQEKTNLHPRGFDYLYKHTSALTRLHFRLKSDVKESTLPKTWSVTLYPNSVLIIPLLTNRLYTHEIRPSILDVDQIPTRLGYVVRCSKTRAIYQAGQTHILTPTGLQPLVRPTKAQLEELRARYLEENLTSNVIQYPEELYFSMNDGDYQAPRTN